MVLTIGCVKVSRIVMFRLPSFLICVHVNRLLDGEAGRRLFVSGLGILRKNSLQLMKMLSYSCEAP